jgi:hypothetical protein
MVLILTQDYSQWKKLVDQATYDTSISMRLHFMVTIQYSNVQQLNLFITINFKVKLHFDVLYHSLILLLIVNY